MSAGKLLNDIKKVTEKDQDTYTLKGVKDLDKNDISRIKSYAEFYAKTDGCSQSGFLPMNDRVKDVLTKYGLLW